MKKLFLSAIIIGITGNTFATCPANYAESGEYIVIGDSDPCPAGYVETNEIVITEGSTSCPTGYVETSESVPVICDNTKGICSTVFTCSAL